MFLAMSYFGTDQSQVQRYLGGRSLRESRLGLMFNAVFKIPMQFFILLLGVLIFVFYQFERPPVFFNKSAWNYQAEHGQGAKLRAIESGFETAHAEEKARLQEWLDARHSGNAAEASAHEAVAAAHEKVEAARAETKAVLKAAGPGSGSNDSDYVFIDFILDYLPHGLIGLLVTASFAAALSSMSIPQPG